MVCSGLVGIVVLAHVGGGWYFASAIDSRALSAEARRADLKPTYRVEVVAVGDSTVTLRTADDERIRRKGTYGIVWDGGWGIVSDTVRVEEGTTVRAFEHKQGSPLVPGMLTALDSRVYQGDPLTSHGIEFETVTYPSDAGPLSAWFVPGDGSTWFVFVHGNSLTRRDGLRVLLTAVDVGLPTLIVTYRGSEDAPDADRRLTYGKEEWHDLEAAVAFARSSGAERVILGGISMGGAVIAAFLLESPLADVVVGAVLDAPLLDFELAVEHQAKRERVPLVGLPLPGTLVATAEWLAGWRFGIDWSYTDYLSRAEELSVPLLLFHGTEDDTVPLATSEELAQKRPDLIRDFYVVVGAGHAESWNHDPTEYGRHLRAFLSERASSADATGIRGIPAASHLTRTQCTRRPSPRLSVLARGEGEGERHAG